ncbi:PREDICTED: uncharacterized protein LOC105005075 [Bison bison bison]|uniref:Small ribosomal subunit protein uS5 n=1 Tax=Bison bison bison TaxID=43346 RepID=A0A6P3J9B9_BISBB|nr:PREDICTED: uncharacterized protein LOC105005075 [Bison bison bison]
MGLQWNIDLSFYIKHNFFLEAPNFGKIEAVQRKTTVPVQLSVLRCASAPAPGPVHVASQCGASHAALDRAASSPFMCILTIKKNEGYVVMIEPEKNLFVLEKLLHTCSYREVDVIKLISMVTTAPDKPNCFQLIAYSKRCRLASALEFTLNSSPKMTLPNGAAPQTDTVIASLALHKVALSAGAYVQKQGEDNHYHHLVGNDNGPGKRGIKAFTDTITAMKELPCVQEICSKEVSTAIRGAIILAKLSIVPVRRGYWGNKIGKPHTVPCKVTGRCGSVLVRLIPAPRGTGIVSAPVPKKLLMMASIDNCYTSARGCTATLGNFAKATFDAISKTYSYLTPDLWKETVFTKSPYQEFTDHLVKTHTRVSVQRTQAPAVATT